MRLQHFILSGLLLIAAPAMAASAMPQGAILMTESDAVPTTDHYTFDAAAIQNSPCRHVTAQDVEIWTKQYACFSADADGVKLPWTIECKDRQLPQPDHLFLLFTSEKACTEQRQEQLSAEGAL